MRLLFLMASICAVATAQTCTLIALTPAEPVRTLENEAGTDSDTFVGVQLTLGTGNRLYFADSMGRIRTVEPDGRLRTLAGNGRRGVVQAGPALESPMSAITQVAVSPAGVVHFAATGRIYRIEGGRIEVAAGSGQPGFNGEASPPLDLNLGTISHFAFSPGGVLYIADGFLRIRRLDADGLLRTFAGSSMPFEFGLPNGDGGPATQAALQLPRQVVPLRDGSVWIRDFRSIRAVGADGNIRLLRDNMDLQVEILLTPEGNPVAASPGRVTPLDGQGREAPPGLFAGFTGNPRAISSAGLYAVSSRQDLITGLFLWNDGASKLIAGAPRRTPASGASTEPFGIFFEPTSSLIYRGTLAGVFGLIESRLGQAPRLLAGLGTDAGDAEGKPLANLSISGIAGFSVDNEGRLVLLDLSRSRVLIVDASGNVTTLKDASRQPVAPIGTGGTLNHSQRIAVDAAGNVYWMLATTPGINGSRAAISVWTRTTSNVTSFVVDDLDRIVQLANGSVAAIVGQSVFERSLRRIEATRLGDVEAGLEGVGFQSATVSGTTPYFVSTPRLFRGGPGSLEVFTDLASPTEPERPLVALFVVSSARGLVLRAGDGAFYRLENPDACSRETQPKITAGGVVSAAGFGYPDTVSIWQLVTVFGSGLGPREGQGIMLDGLERATAQPGPYPSLLLGQRQINGALGGIPLPVVFANDTQMTVQVPFVPASYDTLYWSWNGLLLKYVNPIRVQSTTPGIFAQGAAAAALNQDSSINSPQRPAARGSVVQFFLTGLGEFRPPPGGPGAFNSTATLQRVSEQVTARIGGTPAVVEFAGAAPGFVSGLFQVNVRIPANASTGAQPVEFESAGRVTSRFQQVTVRLE